MHIILVYIGIFFGLFLEGEMVLISAIIAAHHGYLILWIVVALGLTGTYCADCFFFFLGRKRGYVWINKNPKIKKKADIMEKNRKISDNYFSDISVFIWIKICNSSGTRGKQYKNKNFHFL